MLNIFAPFSVQSETGVSDKMATTNECVVNEANSRTQMASKKELTPVKSPKRQNDDSLHKLLQKTTFKPNRESTWARSVTCITQQNLFLEGFRDCASEVIRFLTEEENVNDNNSLLIGLQSHLVNVSKTFCHETITDLDRHDAENENRKYSSCLPTPTEKGRNCNETVSVSQFSPCMMSPIFPRSANSSVSDTYTTESDMSMSLSSISEKGDLSLVSESNSSIDNSHENFIDQLKVDDVFHSPPARDQNTTSSSVSSLRLLSMNAVQNINNQMITVKDDSSKDHSLFFDETDHHNSLSSTFSKQYVQTPNHSSPLPKSPTQSVTHFDYPLNPPHFPHTISRIEANRVPQFPTAPSWNDIFGLDVYPSNQSTKLSADQTQFLNGNVQAATLSSFQSCVPARSNCTEDPQTDSDFLRHINSVLQLTASSQTATETSENFADILLAVESCRAHEDPRVRALAEELVGLIHNDEFEDEDDVSDDDDHIDDEEDNGNSLNEESGVEMLDESSNWGSVVDIYEQ